MNNNTFTPGLTPNTVCASDGRVLTVPDGWVLLPPGDAALTRRVKAAGDHWIVQEKKGRKVFSRGVWAPATTIDQIREKLKEERTDMFTNCSSVSAIGSMPSSQGCQAALAIVLTSRKTGLGFRVFRMRQVVQRRRQLLQHDPASSKLQHHTKTVGGDADKLLADSVMGPRRYRAGC
jgi:hypothetical protein